MEGNVPTQLPKSLWTRRRTPLLGIVGELAGPIFGVMSYNDQEDIDYSIQALNAAQTNLSHLMGKLTHVLRSQVDNLHNEAQLQKVKLEDLKRNLSSVIKRLERNMIPEEERKYSNSLYSVMDATKLGLLHYIKTASKILEAIHSAKKGQLHPALVSIDQFQLIISDITKHSLNTILPVTGPEISIEELIQVSKTSILLTGGNLKVLVDIPLADKMEYSVYRIHSLPVLQDIPANKSGQASIISDYTHISVDEGQRTYILSLEKEFDN